jgi:hypothetical protein
VSPRSAHSRPSRPTWPKASCSGTNGGPSPGLPRRGWEDSRWPTTAPSSWTRSPTFP